MREGQDIGGGCGGEAQDILCWCLHAATKLVIYTKDVNTHCGSQSITLLGAKIAGDISGGIDWWTDVLRMDSRVAHA